MRTKLSLFITILIVASAPINKLSAESLAGAVFKTIASNPEVMAEINRKNARQQELHQAKSGYYPSVDLAAAVGKENSLNRYTIAAGSSDYVDLTRKEEAFIVTYNLFQGFETSSNIEKNSARVRSADHHLHELTEQIALNVSNAYLRVLRMHQLVRLSKETLAEHENLYNKVKSRSLSGVGRRSDINQAEGRVAQARANLIADQASLQNAQSNYLRLTGNMPSGLSQPEDWAKKMPSTIEEAIKLAEKNNPLLKAMQADVEVATAQTTEAKSSYYPRLDLVFEQSRGENIDGIVGVEKDYSLMLKMRYNLFRGGYDVARSRQAALLHNEAKDKLNNVRRSISETMRLAWNSYQAVNMQIPYLQQHVQSIAKTRTAYANQFKIGQRTLLDLLNSENELYQAKRSLVTANYDHLSGCYRILANMGRLVDEMQLAASGR